MWYWCQPLQASTYWVGEVWSRTHLQATVRHPLSLFWVSCFVLFGHPHKSGTALLVGHLPLGYCAPRFACKVPTWRLPVGGGVASLLAEYGDGVAVVRAASGASGSGSLGVLGNCSGGVGSRLSGRGYESSTQQKKPSSSGFFREFWVINLSPVSGRGRGLGFRHWVKMMMLEGGIFMIILFLGPLLKTKLGLAESHWGCTDPRLQVCMGFIGRCMP